MDGRVQIYLLIEVKHNITKMHLSIGVHFLRKKTKELLTVKLQFF